MIELVPAGRRRAAHARHGFADAADTKGVTMSDYSIDTANVCKNCPYIIRECGEVLGCRCDIYGPESCDVANA